MQVCSRKKKKENRERAKVLVILQTTVNLLASFLLFFPSAKMSRFRKNGIWKRTAGYLWEQEQAGVLKAWPSFRSCTSEIQGPIGTCKKKTRQMCNCRDLAVRAEKNLSIIYSHPTFSTYKLGNKGKWGSDLPKTPTPEWDLLVSAGNIGKVLGHGSWDQIAWVQIPIVWYVI